MMEQSRVASQSKMKTWHTTWCIPLSRIRDFADVIFAASANSIKRVRGWCICWCTCICVKCTNRQAGTHTPCIGGNHAICLSCQNFNTACTMRHTYKRAPPYTLHRVFVRFPSQRPYILLVDSFWIIRSSLEFRHRYSVHLCCAYKYVDQSFRQSVNQCLRIRLCVREWASVCVLPDHVPGYVLFEHFRIRCCPLARCVKHFHSSIDWDSFNSNLLDSILFMDARVCLKSFYFT